MILIASTTYIAGADSEPAQPTQSMAIAAIADQPATARDGDGANELSMFFVVGIVINMLVITCFAIWFSREWNRKKSARKPK